MVLLSIYLVFSGPPSDPNDPGEADIAFVLSPLIAFLAAMATGVLLWVVGALRLADVTVGRARQAAVAGAIIGPLIYWALLFVLIPTLDSAQSGRDYDLVSFAVPTVCGVGVTLVVAVVRRRSPAS